MSKVFFSHGKESGPWGTKIQHLARVAEKYGYGVVSPDYRQTPDPESRVEQLLRTVKEQGEPRVLVGSSMGGYVATLASQKLRPAGLFLMAPAFYLPGYLEQDPRPGAEQTEVVHGWDDRVVPAQHAIRFAERHKACLHLLCAGHQLTEELPTVVKLFDVFLQKLCDATD